MPKIDRPITQKTPPTPPAGEALRKAVGDIDTAIRTFWRLLNEAYPNRQWGGTNSKDGSWREDKVLEEVLPKFYRTAELNFTWLFVLMGLVKPEELEGADRDWYHKVNMFFGDLPEKYMDQWNLWPTKDGEKPGKKRKGDDD
jgi:hypothetical protein